MNGLGFLAMVAGVGRLQRTMSSIAAVGVGLTGVALVLAPFVVATSGSAALSTLAALTAHDIGLFVFMGCVATGGAHAFFAKGLSLCRSPADALTAMMIEPLFATFLAVGILQEALTGTAVAGCALLLASMGLLYWSERRSSDGRGPA